MKVIAVTAMLAALTASTALGDEHSTVRAMVIRDGGYSSAQAARTRLNGGATMPQPIAGIRTDKQSYGLGEQVKIDFIVENRTKQEITLRFPSGQKYDIWARKDGSEVWRWSRGRVFIQALTSLTLKPGERKVFRETWKQVTDKGEQVGPGSYDLFAQLTTFPPRPAPVKTQITVGTARPVVKPTTVAGIVNNIDAAVGQLVQITGTYRGWRPDPNSPACRPGPPVTRADWAVSDQTGCIFVTGRSGLDPTDDYGRAVTVVGVVRKTAKGQPYIEARSVTPGAE